MEENEHRIDPVDRWIIDPLNRFISNSTTSGIVLFSSAALALILSNSPWSDEFQQIWKHKVSIGYDAYIISKDLHHWINDGLMSLFFFVVGLELKREIIAGELSDLKKAALPIAAAIGGMLVPALIYLLFNRSGDTADGWGIPMATDIAFALGVLYLLGDKVPLSLKIFLTVLAIADDIGAVLVIAFFYTSDINVISLFTGAAFMAVLIVANVIGVRSTLFYGIVGIAGLWLAFIMSGVHATIAGVLAAFTIPARVKVSANYYSQKLEQLLVLFKSAEVNTLPTVSKEQFKILSKIENFSEQALTPLQRLEHTMHPFVAFLIMPIFALSNAGVELSSNFLTQIQSPVSLGIFFGLLAGKVIGVVGVVYLMLRLRWAVLPQGVNMLHIWGTGFVAAIGFTMSLFISGLAFRQEEYAVQAKLGVLAASITASVIGYCIIRIANKKNVG
ncbi:MAG: Na+/H+ antiporter NhaA [Cyclobacteriaceae bacterium]|nr:Na+/H+ antiporter NhaA [Cyclobacteriaceae bacterium]